MPATKTNNQGMMQNDKDVILTSAILYVYKALPVIAACRLAIKL